MKPSVSKERALSNAMASVRIEGLSVSPYASALLKKLLNKEISREEYIRAIIDAKRE